MKLIDLASRQPPQPSTTDLEFSDIGRDPAFPEGWFVTPIIVIGATIALAAASYVVPFLWRTL